MLTAAYICLGVVLTLISLLGLVAGLELAAVIVGWWKRR
jgi:hypothetical protein